jgi:hypothetical protein
LKRALVRRRIGDERIIDMVEFEDLAQTARPAGGVEKSMSVSGRPR